MAVGDTVAVNQIIVDIETAKSVVELPSPYAGEVVELLAAAGETVEVGTPIIAIQTASDVPAPSAQTPLAAGDTTDTEPKLPVGHGVREAGATRRRRGANAHKPVDKPPAERIHSHSRLPAPPQVAGGNQLRAIPVPPAGFDLPSGLLVRDFGAGEP